ncbi:MAG TPA: MFS transporter [Actinomycetota bacterium]|jgi:MFS family permease|nr:MFS transporter [Actinomycetota bacterium]
MRRRLQAVARTARDPRLLRIELAYLGFNMAEHATWLAMLVYAYAEGGAVAAGVVALILLIPSAVIAPFAAYSGDRFRRDRVLLASYVIQAASFGLAAAVLYLEAPLPIVFLVAVAYAVSLTFTRPAQASLLPSITRTPQDLTAANVVSGFVESLGIALGPLVAGLILGASEPAMVFAVFAVTTALGAIAVATMPVDPRDVEPPRRADAEDVVRDTLGGFRALRRERDVRLLVMLLSAGILVIGALDILYVAAAIDLLDIGQRGAGYLAAAAGVGGIIGATAFAAVASHERLSVPLVAGALLFGLSIAVIAASPDVAATVGLVVAAGAGRSVSAVSGNVLLQRIAPGEVLARVFGVLEGLRMLALGIGSVLASGLVAWLGIEGALIALGAFVPFIVLLAFRRILAIDREAEAPDAEAIALLRRTSIFAPLPEISLQRVAKQLSSIAFSAGVPIIREGDVGDRFYILAEGTARVTREGEHVVDRAPGDYFGEIALLRDVPRTATVTATTPVRLFALEREAFLEAVTGHPQSLHAADRIAEERSAEPER